MKTIEEIVLMFEALSPATSNQWNVATVVPSRLYVSRTEDNNYAVFLEGEIDSFGKLSTISGLEHCTEVTALPASRKFAALRMTSRDETNSNRVMAHIAYELARKLDADPAISNDELFRQVEWVLLLLGAGDAMLSAERQRGLVGECVMLRKLLIVGRAAGISASAVLSRWWGYETARRDFAAQGIAVEVKTTSRNSRQHHIGSIEQLDPQFPNEVVYVFSLGIKNDASAARKLPHFVADVEAQLIGLVGEPDVAALERFRKQLAAYGYDRAREAAYLGGPGYMKPHLPGALFREASLHRIRHQSFVADKLPEMVREVSYVLDITSEPLDKLEVESVWQTLIHAIPITYQ